ncbi:uncharacterized protein ACO6RY_10672 [Pungitius sinensis]
MALANAEITVREGDLERCLPQIYKALLTAACLSCPNDPIQFLKNRLVAFQGHDNLQHVDWYKFFADAEQHLSTISETTVDPVFTDPGDTMMSYGLFENAYCCYRNTLTNTCFR